MKLRTAVLAIAISAVACGGTPSAEREAAAEKSEEWTAHRLLEGRLVIEAPSSSELEDNAIRGGVGTAPDPFVQSRLRAKVGAVEIIIQAEELFALAPTNAREQIEQGQPPGATIQPLEKVTGFAVFHERQQVGKDELLLADVFVIQPDRMMQRIHFVTWDADPEALEVARKSVRRMVASITEGGSQLRTSAGIRKLAVGLPGDMELIGDLPKGYYVQHERGVDFQVTYVGPIRLAGEQGPRLGIFVGSGANWLHIARQAPPEQIREDKAPLLGESQTWKAWTDSHPSGEVAFREAMAEIGTEGAKVHAFIQGPAADADLNALAEVAQGIQIRPSSGAPPTP